MLPSVAAPFTWLKPSKAKCSSKREQERRIDRASIAAINGRAIRRIRWCFKLLSPTRLGATLPKRSCSSGRPKLAAERVKDKRVRVAFLNVSCSHLITTAHNGGTLLRRHDKTSNRQIAHHHQENKIPPLVPYSRLPISHHVLRLRCLGE